MFFLPSRSLRRTSFPFWSGSVKSGARSPTCTLPATVRVCLLSKLIAFSLVLLLHINWWVDAHYSSSSSSSACVLTCQGEMSYLDRLIYALYTLFNRTRP